VVAGFVGAILAHLAHVGVVVVGADVVGVADGADKAARRIADVALNRLHDLFVARIAVVEVVGLADDAVIVAVGTEVVVVVAAVGGVGEGDCAGEAAGGTIDRAADDERQAVAAAVAVVELVAAGVDLFVVVILADGTDVRVAVDTGRGGMVRNRAGEAGLGVADRAFDEQIGGVAAGVAVVEVVGAVAVFVLEADVVVAVIAVGSVGVVDGP